MLLLPVKSKTKLIFISVDVRLGHIQITLVYHCFLIVWYPWKPILSEKVKLHPLERKAQFLSASICLSPFICIFPRCQRSPLFLMSIILQNGFNLSGSKVMAEREYILFVCVCGIKAGMVHNIHII